VEIMRRVLGLEHSTTLEVMKQSSKRLWRAG